jgi:predicted nuclease of predicted toxin-antitoxin system
VLAAASADQRVVLTGDKDFGELVYRLGRASAGVVLIRLAGLSNRSKALIVSEAIILHGAELRGAFGVIEPGRIRIRKP